MALPRTFWPDLTTGSGRRLSAPRRPAGQSNHAVCTLPCPASCNARAIPSETFLTHPTHSQPLQHVLHPTRALIRPLGARRLRDLPPGALKYFSMPAKAKALGLAPPALEEPTAGGMDAPVALARRNAVQPPPEHVYVKLFDTSIHELPFEVRLGVGLGGQAAGQQARVASGLQSPMHMARKHAGQAPGPQQFAPPRARCARPPRRPPRMPHLLQAARASAT